MDFSVRKFPLPVVCDTVMGNIVKKQKSVLEDNVKSRPEVRDDGFNLDTRNYQPQDEKNLINNNIIIIIFINSKNYRYCLNYYKNLMKITGRVIHK